MFDRSFIKPHYDKINFINTIIDVIFKGFTFKWPSEWKNTVVDKHSTGGIGDKVKKLLICVIVVHAHS